jgi:histidine decarboxylase
MDQSYSTQPVTPITDRLIPSINDTSQNDIAAILHDYHGKLEVATTNHMGYPYNLSHDYSRLKQFIDFSINNLGDPFIESNYGVHSRVFEIAVLDWFADIWHISKNDYWGYITNSGTEGNLHGIWTGRENFPTGILYASEDSHYSVFKAARMFKIPCEKITSNEEGSINLEHLKEQLLKNKGRPAIININIGTTLKGAIDDLDSIIDLLHECGYDDDKDFYLHLDGALVGIMISLLESDYISFAKKPIGSISVSGHKFIGSPIPCGVVITRLKHITALSQNIEYINSRDATIMGSRNGHAPLFLWYTLVSKCKDGIYRDIINCIENAKYVKSKLEEKNVEGVMLNKWSNTVVFKRPSDNKFILKYQLACSGDLAHIVVMPNIDTAKLDRFVEDYCRCR